MQFLAIAAFALCSFQQPAPTPPAPAPQAKPAQVEKPKPYDEAADAKADIATALARAAAENRRVLIQWGGNWCGWCVKLHELYGSDAAIRKKLLYEYDVVYVDIGRWDKNQELAQQYGADLKTGVPYLTVLDAASKVLANQETGVLEDKVSQDRHDPAKVLEFLAKNQAPYLKADELLAAARAQALQEHKQVFLSFGAPWCGWCHKLERWEASPEAHTLLAKEFVLRKIDVERTQGGKELALAYRKSEGGIPWFCVLDAEGKIVGTSNDENGDTIGFPYKDEEIAVFTALLKQVAVHLTPEDIAALEHSLVEVRKSDERAAQAKQKKAS